jgi:hypothetical protein
MRVELAESSHNAADSLSELIRMGLPYILLVWNPFVTAFASEAGKDTYVSMRRWMRALLNKLAERRAPILEIQSHHSDCYISFLFRGTGVKRLYAAHESRAHDGGAYGSATLAFTGDARASWK